MAAISKPPKTAAIECSLRWAISDDIAEIMGCVFEAEAKNYAALE